jgi:hypothetical protein
MIEAIVRRRWRWYQMGALAVTTVLGIGFIALWAAGASLAVGVIGLAWLALGVAGATSLRRVAWSLRLDADDLLLDGPTLHTSVPVASIQSAYVSGVSPSRTVLRLEIAGVGRVRFGPLPPDAHELLAALRATCPAFATVG